MVLFWKKQKSIEEMIDSYFDVCDGCLAQFDKAITTYLEHGLGEAFDAEVAATHESESAGDDKRREIELTLYGKALLPDSRGDLLGLLETYDRIPNATETVLFTLHSQRVILPQAFHTPFRNLVNVNLLAYSAARKAVDALFSNPKATLHATKEVDERESESDRLERRLIAAIFDADMDTGTKLMLKEIVLLVGEISDRAEAAADRIAIIAIKRQI
jgi:predicted phosphate transport protein (TIGR00153 family)